MNSTVSGAILIVIGLLAMVGAALNWRLISRSRKLINLVLGVLLFIAGIGRLISVNWLRR